MAELSETMKNDFSKRMKKTALDRVETHIINCVGNILALTATLTIFSITYLWNKYFFPNWLIFIIFIFNAMQILLTFGEWILLRRELIIWKEIQ